MAFPRSYRRARAVSSRGGEVVFRIAVLIIALLASSAAAQASTTIPNALTLTSVVVSSSGDAVGTSSTIALEWAVNTELTTQPMNPLEFFVSGCPSQGGSELVLSGETDFGIFVEVYNPSPTQIIHVLTLTNSITTHTNLYDSATQTVSFCIVASLLDDPNNINNTYLARRQVPLKISLQPNGAIQEVSTNAQSRPVVDDSAGAVALPVDFLWLAAGVCDESLESTSTAIITQGQAVSICLYNPYYLTYSVVSLYYFEFTVTIPGVGSYTQPAVTDGVVDAFTTVMTCTTPTDSLTETQTCRFDSFLVPALFDFWQQHGGTQAATIAATGKAVLVPQPVGGRLLELRRASQRSPLLRHHHHHHRSNLEQQPAEGGFEFSFQIQIPPPTVDDASSSSTQRADESSSVSLGVKIAMASSWVLLLWMIISTG